MAMNRLEDQDKAQAKKPYASPQLRTYGNLAAVTLALGGIVGKNDGGAGKDKTG